MADFERQRLSMVNSLRPNEVTDRRIIAAMASLPRERFVPQRLSLLAFMDESIEEYSAIDGAPARFLLAPMPLARLVQVASVEPEDKVLDVGCATGYSTALLARLAKQIVGLEPEPELAEAARSNLRALGIGNAAIVEGALADGCAREPVRRHPPERERAGIPQALLDQLREGGRLVAILSTGATSVRPGKAFLFVKIDGEASGLSRFDAGARVFRLFPRSCLRLLVFPGPLTALLPRSHSRLSFLPNPAPTSFSWVSPCAYAALWFEPQWGRGRH